MENIDSLPLYNSRIIQTYVDFLRNTYPAIEIDGVLQQAGLNRDEIDDPGHWFTQDQADRFHETLVLSTGDKHISRHAGRFGASAKGIGLLKQYVLGLMNIETVFDSTTKLMPLLTKGATLKGKRLGTRKVEIISTPASGVHEKPYQCENRLGVIETLPKLFTNTYARVEHPQCFHRGDPFCRYIVTWNTSPSLRLKVVRNYAIVLSAVLLLTGFFSLPATALPMTASIMVGCNLAISAGYLYRKSKELENVLDFYHETTEEQMVSANVNYNNALLVQEIGHATAAIFDVNELMNELAMLMQKRLPFDRGLIMLSDGAGGQLAYTAGYGYSAEEVRYFQNSVIDLNNPRSQGAFVRSFLDQKCVITDGIDGRDATPSEKGRAPGKRLGAFSFLCVPILFKQKSLGILAVDSITSKASYKRSDVNLLQGIASHIAISINNSKIFQKLKDGESRYRQTLESIVEGYFEVDCNYKVRFANKALCELLACTSDELIDSPFGQHFRSDGEQSFEELFKGIQEDGRTVRFAHLKMSRKDRGILPVDLSASLVLDPNGRKAGFRGLIRDATDRLKIEQEKGLLETRLLQAQKMEAIGTLAGGIAHNFNNWLHGILGNTALIQIEARRGKNISERIQKIESLVDSAAKMTQQLLGYARGGKYRIDQIDLNKIIQESAETFRVARKDISIQLRLDASAAAIKADRSQIEQVLWNLYANAVDAMPRGGQIDIATSRATEKELRLFGHEMSEGSYVCVSITDSGIGIEPKYQHNIFEPFFTTKAGKGNGLGLASVYGIVKSHGGYINVKSSPGKGSTFYVFLPEAQNPCAASDTNEIRCIRSGHETVLVVDDDEMTLDTCCALLSEVGYITLKALNGEEALKIYTARKKSIDLIIIDMIMPVMSGKELYARIKQLNPGAKTLLSSGYSLNDQAQEILESGCNGFIQKPYNIYELCDAINRIVDPALYN